MLRNTLQVGLVRSLHHWRLLLPLFLVSLVLGLINIWPLYTAVGNGALRSPITRSMATNLGSTLGDMVFGVGLGTIGLFGTLWLLGLVVGALVFGLAYNFFAGGILCRYANKQPFWVGCRRYVWTFTGLGFLAITCLGALGALGDYLARQVGASGTLRLIVLVVITQIINTVFEYARALAVAHDERNPGVALGKAIRFCIAQVGGVVALALLGGALFGALAGVYNAVADLLAPLAVVVLLIVWQQLFVLGQQGIKLLRLSWALAFVQAQARTTQQTQLSSPAVP